MSIYKNTDFIFHSLFLWLINQSLDADAILEPRFASSSLLICVSTERAYGWH